MEFQFSTTYVEATFELILNNEYYVSFGEQLHFWLLSVFVSNLYCLCIQFLQYLLACSYTASEVDISSDKTPEQRALLVESRR